MVQCTCGEILAKNKEVLLRHEAKVHDYNSPKYKPHITKHLTDDEFNEEVNRGEEKFKHALFIPDNLRNLRCRRTGHGQK